MRELQREDPAEAQADVVAIIRSSGWAVRWVEPAENRGRWPGTAGSARHGAGSRCRADGARRA
ncbi:hypothetical protein GCM10025792_32450 [Pseudonocardia tropica]